MWFNKITNLPSDFETKPVSEVSFLNICDITGEVHESAVPALTAAKQTEMCRQIVKLLLLLITSYLLWLQQIALFWIFAGLLAVQDHTALDL